MNELSREQWAIVKQLFAFVQKQQQLIESIGTSHHELRHVLAGHFGFAESPEPAEVMTEAQKAELLELERMFAAADDDEGEKQP